MKSDNNENEIKSNPFSLATEHSCRLSEFASFSVENILNTNNARINFTYKDPKKIHPHLMLVIFTPDNVIKEIPMNYDEKNKSWSIDIERSINFGAKFLITTAKEPGKEENQKATVLQSGIIALNNGIIQPLNKEQDIPAGKLETFLLTSTGEIKKTDNADENELKSGERFITIYTPPGYDDPKQKSPYDLQITLDGGQYLNIMKMNVVLDHLIAKNQIEPTVVVFISPHSGPPVKEKKGFTVVMPEGYSLAMRLKEYCCNPEFSDYLKSLPATLRKQFKNITDDPKHTTLWGVSAGGLQAVYTGLLHPNVFGNVVAESPMSWNIPVQNGPDWRKGIVDSWKKEDDITWATATAILPKKEEEHKEHITEMVQTGKDSISGRKLDESSSVRFYIDAGSEESEYKPEIGSANLLKGAEVFANAAKKKGHTIVDDGVHVIPEGIHHNMTWMRNIANASKAIHPIHSLSATLTTTTAEQLTFSQLQAASHPTETKSNLPSQETTSEQARSTHAESNNSQVANDLVDASQESNMSKKPKP